MRKTNQSNLSRQSQPTNMMGRTSRCPVVGLACVALVVASATCRARGRERNVSDLHFVKVKVCHWGLSQNSSSQTFHLRRTVAAKVRLVVSRWLGRQPELTCNSVYMHHVCTGTGIVDALHTNLSLYVPKVAQTISFGHTSNGIASWILRQRMMSWKQAIMNAKHYDDRWTTLYSTLNPAISTKHKGHRKQAKRWEGDTPSHTNNQPESTKTTTISLPRHDFGTPRRARL